MVLHRKHLLSEKKKTLVAATLAKKIGYLKIQDVVPSGIVEHLETQSFNPNKIISTKNKLYLVKEGSVEIWHTHYDKLVKTLELGMLFGNMPVLGQVMIGTRAISGTDGTILVEITTDTAKNWLKSNPLAIGEWLGTRLAEIEVKHYRAAFQLADSRVSALLLELANDDLVVEGLTHKDLALRIGLYRETITNVLSVMKQDKLIKVGRERITILDKTSITRTERIVMSKVQTEASNYIRNLLASRQLILTPRTMTFEDNKQWMIFEYKDREIGIDPLSGVWIRTKDDNWRCLATPCNVSGALQAVEFLIKE